MNKQYNISEERLKEFIEMITRIAGHDFGFKLNTTGRDSAGDIIAGGLNMLAEEWEDSLISKNKLLESQRKYATLFQNSFDIILVLETNSSIITESNSKAYNFFNDQNQELILAESKFDDLLKFKEFNFERICSQIENSDSFFFKDVLEYDNSECKYIEANACSVFYGEKNYIQFHFRDITHEATILNDLKKSENRYRGLFEKMNDGLVFVNELGVIEVVNPSFCAMLGYSLNELLGENIYTFLVDWEVSKKLKSRLDKLKKGSKEEFEIQMIHKKLNRIWVQIKSYPNFSENEEFIGVMSVVSDITNRKYLEEQREGAYLLLKKNEQRLRNENREVLKYQSLLLSSQLNPHFIFNALNSIQYHILDDDPEPSLEFVSNFANLIRKVMQNSEKEFVTIKEELSFLSDYLNLEKSRHHDKFDFLIQIEDEHLNENKLIPPMLLQPFVENAIIHGVRHLSSGGKIQILVKKKGKDKMMVEIIDNGLGLNKAKQINQLKVGEEKLKSSAINRSRIDILNDIGDFGRFEINLVDMGEIRASARGTKATIVFPNIIEE